MLQTSNKREINLQEGKSSSIIHSSKKSLNTTANRIEEFIREGYPFKGYHLLSGSSTDSSILFHNNKTQSKVLL